MPNRAPTHQAFTPAPRQPRFERVRGRALQQRRERFFHHHPLCVECLKEDRVKEAVELDHVIPLWKGGADHESNEQGLCREHHAQKTAREQRERMGLLA